jgi:hypothetical protein
MHRRLCKKPSKCDLLRYRPEAGGVCQRVDTLLSCHARELGHQQPTTGSPLRMTTKPPTASSNSRCAKSSQIL